MARTKHFVGAWKGCLFVCFSSSHFPVYFLTILHNHISRIFPNVFAFSAYFSRTLFVFILNQSHIFPICGRLCGKNAQNSPVMKTPSNLFFVAAFFLRDSTRMNPMFDFLCWHWRTEGFPSLFKATKFRKIPSIFTSPPTA